MGFQTCKHTLALHIPTDSNVDKWNDCMLSNELCPHAGQQYNCPNYEPANDEPYEISALIRKRCDFATPEESDMGEIIEGFNVIDIFSVYMFIKRYRDSIMYLHDEQPEAYKEFKSLMEIRLNQEFTISELEFWCMDTYHDWIIQYAFTDVSRTERCKLCKSRLYKLIFDGAPICPKCGFIEEE